MQAAETQLAPDVVDRLDQETVDEYDLAALGHEQSLSRKFDLWSILALAFCVLGTWSTFAQVSVVFVSSRIGRVWDGSQEQHVFNMHRTLQIPPE